MKKGFTLIELLITITIFAIAITGFVNLFASAMQEQRKNLDLAYMLNNTSYVTEYISRALRMAKKDISGSCITAKDNFEPSDGEADYIQFLSYDGTTCQKFFLQGTAIKVEKNGVSHPLTPSNLEVESLKFKVSGASQEDNLQPKATFIIKLKNSDFPNLQTTISQRQLDVNY